MASRGFSKALRKPLTQQLLAPRIQTRGFLSVIGSSRARVTSVGKAVLPVQQVRGVKTIDFAGHQEKVYGMAIAIDCEVGGVADKWAQSARIGLERSFL